MRFSYSLPRNLLRRLPSPRLRLLPSERCVTAVPEVSLGSKDRVAQVTVEDVTTTGLVTLSMAFMSRNQFSRRAAHRL